MTKEYHAHPAVGRSLLAMLAKSPRRCQLLMSGQQTFKPSTEKAFANGTAVHDVMAGITDNIRVIPSEVLAKNGARSTNDYRRFKAEQKPGTVLVTEKELAAIKDQADPLREQYSSLIDNPVAISEEPIFWTATAWVRTAEGQAANDPDAPRTPVEVECKCLPDLLIPTNREVCVTDWKTMAELPTEDTFERAAQRGGYTLQWAHYSQGIEAHYGRPVKPFVFACVEKSPPYEIASFTLDDETQAEALEDWQELLNEFAERRASNNWARETERKITPVRVRRAR